MIIRFVATKIKTVIFVIVCCSKMTTAHSAACAAV